MKRYSLLIEGKAGDFLSKIPGRKRSLIVNAIINQALKNKKTKELMANFFSDEEINELLTFKRETKKVPKKQDSVEPTLSVENKKPDKQTFKVKL